MSARPGGLELPSPPGALVLPVLPGALCAGRDPGLWFPGRGGSMAEAIAVCRACPARVHCVQWALQADERAGVWGGTSPDQRALIRRAAKTAGPVSAAPDTMLPAGLVIVTGPPGDGRARGGWR